MARGRSDEPDDPAQQAEREDSIARLEAGGIPLEAERRLRAMAGSGLFTSGLSVAEFAVGHELGLKPLGQVMGGSIHQVGYQYLASGFYGQEVFTELDTITHAWDQARRRSLQRLSEEARHLGANAVVGVHLHRGAHDWAAGCVDYVVTGTAVRTAGGGDAGEPALTDLSVQDYSKLVRAGYEPVALTAATSVFFVAPSRATQWSRAMTSYYNQELTDYTRGFYAARETALGRLTSQANAAGASGIVGVRIEQHAQPIRLGAGANDRGGMQITFHVLGTAVREVAPERLDPPETIVKLGGTS